MKPRGGRTEQCLYRSAGTRGGRVAQQSFIVQTVGRAGVSLRKVAVDRPARKITRPLLPSPQGKRIHLLQPEKQGFPV